MAEEKIIIPEEVRNQDQPHDPLKAPEIDTSISTLSDKDIQNASEQVDKIEKYGDSPIQTAAEAAISAATFGASDQILKKLSPEMAEAVRQRRILNPGSAIAGEVAGIVAPTLASGGTSLLAKGAQAAGAGVLGAAKASQAVESLSAAALRKIFKDTGRSKLAQDIVAKTISKGAGSAVEGSFYGLGKLVSEEALGNAEFNAESVAAHAGVGALLGGAAGGIFGAGDAIIPVIRNSKIVDYTVKKLKPNLSAEKAALEYSGFTPLQASKLRGDIKDNIVPFYNNRIKLELFKSGEEVADKVKNSIDEIGEEIGSTLNKIDEVAPINVLPTRNSISTSIIQKLEPLKEEFSGLASSSAQKYLKQINKEIDNWLDWSTKTVRLTGKEVHGLKVKLQNLAKWDKKFDSLSIDEKIAREASEGVREQLLSLADNVSLNVNDELGRQLRKQNLDYATAIEVNKHLTKKMIKQDSKNFFSLRDSIIGGFGYSIDPALAMGTIAAKKFAESDLKRKLLITTNIERSIQSINNRISSGVKAAFKGADKVKKAVKSGTVKGMLGVSFAMNDQKRPSSENRLEAYKRIKNELNELNTNMEASLKYIANNSLRSSGAAPMTAAALDSIMMKAINFLEDKLPKSENSSGGLQIIKRQWVPSTLELSKFEKYVEAVENPLSVIDDLQSGTLSREKVEAIEVLYPSLYVKIQEEIMSNLPEFAEKLTYSQRLQLGILMNIETDSSLQPLNIKALQQTFIDQQEQKSATGPLAGNAPVEFAQSRATSLEKVQKRS